MSWVRTKLSYANVMATIAVFLALGGGAYAVSLKRNSVGPKQLKTDAVTGIDAKESTFGQVPSAASATSAADASNAGLLDSLDSSAFLRGGFRHHNTASTTPSVAGISVLELNYDVNTVVTNLTGGVLGQIVVLSAFNSNVDINDSGNFFLQAAWTPGLDDTLTLVNLGIWAEVARSAN